jgi:hypothetical protein
VTELAIRTQLDRARTALADVQTVDEAVNVKRFAESVRYATKQAKAGMDAQNEAAEIRLRAERRAGELLRVAVTPSNQHTGRSLPEGVRKHESHRYQQVAEIPEPVFEEYIAGKKDAAQEITTSELLRKGRASTRDVAKEALRAIEGRSTVTRSSRTLTEQLRDANQTRWYYESFGSDPYGSVFFAERANRQLRRLAAKRIKLTDDQAERVAAALRDAASELEGVRPEGPPA